MSTSDQPLQRHGHDTPTNYDEFQHPVTILPENVLSKDCKTLELSEDCKTLELPAKCRRSRFGTLQTGA